jgi:hypothetical protein
MNQPTWIGRTLSGRYKIEALLGQGVCPLSTKQWTQDSIWGPRPFTGYRESDRPAQATQICALAANNNHSVIAESGNCVNLP